MDWKSTRILLASTATAVIASQVVKKVYKYFCTKKQNSQTKINDDETRIEELNIKNREINDVILFSDDIIRHTIKVPPNKDITICESRELNCFKLIKYIKSARETLDVCMYLITSNEIAEQIIRLGQKHVLVRIIADSEMAHTPPSQIKRLEEYSFIQVQTNKKSILMHHKFCIIDGPKAIKRKNVLKAYAEKLNVHAKYTKMIVKQQPKPKSVKGFVMSGSLNWSTQAMVSNHESVIVTSHPNIVGKFEKEFDSLWVENDPALTAMSGVTMS
ncbi:mitochondrial cardiolipin hydrolase-like [Achroia grisella]|uniref:mitochondrial cardiolipin hydrolase-like n=1 Tax=Achroia grisella TaxID=688607 RepID=UPI0027D326BE|nr:mitochondrial cardiolipin hydrolase-like [Achroia grisella]XP_059050745.1 mitochondrial cardiolipin hydrolase-like [Achroia grisella]